MENDKIPFGKKLRVGNFYVLKHTKSISGSELKRWRTAKGIPAEIQRTLGRGGLPYIKVSTIGENWSIELACTQHMYMVIDSQPTEMGVFTDEAVTNLKNLFTTWYADTCLIGDNEYLEDKGRAIKAFMERQKAKDVSEEEDAKILKEEQVRLKAEKDLQDMADNTGKEVKDGGNGQTD
jgi:hypothetical protein